MKRSLIFGAVVLLLLLNLALGANMYLAASRTAKTDDTEQAGLRLFKEALEDIHSEYVDGKDLTYRQLVYSALKGAVSKLDPHSEFLDADSFQELQDDTEGQFGGVGLMVGMKDGQITVIAPMDDTPGSRAGILSGDRIVKVEGKSVEKMALPEVVKMLRGDPGSKVSLTVERPGSGTQKTFTLTRAVIQMDMVKDLNSKKEFPLGDNKIGYVRITQFGEKTGEELEVALDKLKEQGMKGLILDLRWNPGGLLDQAVDVCQKFLPVGQLVVSTEGRHTKEKYYARGHGDEFKDMPIVVLANLGSASAAEIVTGCLQDLHRAVVLGEKTFGKGSVQNIMQFILVPLTDAEEAALVIKRSPGEIESLPAAERAAVDATHDEQLERAEDLLKGLILYDGLTKKAKAEKMAAK
jgi:carboxyl-terminal processing protease